MELEIFLNAYDVYAAVVEHFAQNYLSSRNDLFVFGKD